MNYADEKGKIVSTPDAKILVVDDNTINLNVVRGLLRLCQITPDTAESGKQAIEMIRTKPYDLVFMDHMMPEMDGIEATNIIRSMGTTIPVIALTANAVVDAREEFLAAGMNDFLTKPISSRCCTKFWKPGFPLKNWTFPRPRPPRPYPLRNFRRRLKHRRE